MRCPSCAADLPAGSRACSDCRPASAGEEPLGVSIVAIEGLLAPATPRRATAASTSAAARCATASAPPRFAPGEVVAGRYRVVERVGSGGMGEVWRAEDLNLGEPVALKFLPRELAQDRFWLARLRGEVHAAHAVTHPHVCRVHDIVEVEGSTCLSMEYVDGEDLASLLVRIRQMPEDKAIEIARAICSGLAAAHRQGILHRDLKPSNIMLDKRGEVRLTDFGLAVDLRDGAVAPSNAGTPAYMAPEQLAGEPASVQSDVYALGLVLYELFTGARPFPGATMAAMQRARTRSRLAPPSALAPRIDPLVERAILACLESDPARRPVSALSVAAMLPGADPLSALLAAGETPSPELVASAGGSGGLAPAVAWTLFAVVIAAGAAIAWLNRGAHMLRYVDLRLPPQVLEDRARELLGRVLPGRGALDSAAGFDFDGAAIAHVESGGELDGDARGRWEQLASESSPGVFFWYRESPGWLVPQDASGRVTRADPPLDADGATDLRLSPRGRLLAFAHGVSGWEGAPPASTNVDWAPFFEAAGLERARFESVEPRWGFGSPNDLCVAWRSRSAGADALHVEAAALRGRPVGFRVFEAWELPTAAPDPIAPAPSWPASLQFLLTCLAIFGGAFWARRNLARGLGDRAGATRIAAAFLLLQMLVWLLRAHHVPDAMLERALLFRGLAQALLGAAILWLIYLALEPYVRRIWPDSMISWNRLLAGKWRDPLVGADVLVGLTVSTLAALVDRAQFHLAERWSAMPPRPISFLLDALLGLRVQVAATLFELLDSMLGAMSMLCVLVLLRLLVRSRLLAVAVFAAVLLLALPAALRNQSLGLSLVGSAVLLGVAFPLILRRGLVALVSALFCYSFLRHFPLSLELDGWMRDASLFTAVVALGLALYALIVSTRGARVLAAPAPALVASRASQLA